MRFIAFIVALTLSACATAAAPQHVNGCPPAGYDRAALDVLKANQWTITDAHARNAFALGLTACLASPDPTLRDGVAFEALQRMMRARQLSSETMMALQDDLEARLIAPDPQGFARAFAALALAEVARADRIEPYLTPERRERLLSAGAGYLASVRDYRGFDEREGWRHGVAHGADLMLQLALNPAFGRAQLTRIRDAVATQIAPDGHFYIYGESERLAAPILYIARRNEFSEAEWSAWFVEITGPGPLGDWSNAFASQAGLARRHNVSAFVVSVFANARLAPNDAFASLLPGAEAGLRALP